jgi:hypothetical protein
MLVRDEPLPGFLAQAHREARRRAEDVQQRMAMGNGALAAMRRSVTSNDPGPPRLFLAALQTVAFSATPQSVSVVSQSESSKLLDRDSSDPVSS